MVIIMMKPCHSESKVRSKDVNEDGVSSVHGTNVVTADLLVDHKEGDLQHLEWWWLWITNGSYDMIGVHKW